ncbi:MAG: 3-oxoacid CoA-transferase subunit A [Pseudomonadota bacterium]
MVDKLVPDIAAALDGIPDGATIAISGFGNAGNPTDLVHGLIDQGAAGLTVINNNAGNGHVGLAALLEAERVAKMICSFPRSRDPVVFESLYRAGKIALETVPQGTLAERIRIAGVGIGGFYTPTSVGTPLAEGKEERVIDGRRMVLETPLHADYALIKAWKADRWGNLFYRRAARNFAPMMAMAARTTIVQVQHIVDLGEIEPENVMTPGIFVDRVVHIPVPTDENALHDAEQAARKAGEKQ